MNTPNTYSVARRLFYRILPISTLILTIAGGRSLAFAVLCDGCPETCVGCSFGVQQRGPTCTSLSEEEIEHASSGGGITTIEDLYIHKGYWRATNTSSNIHKCFNTKACSGGMTGALDFCLSGYEGPCKPTRADELCVIFGVAFDYIAWRTGK